MKNNTVILVHQQIPSLFTKHFISHIVFIGLNTPLRLAPLALRGQFLNHQLKPYHGSLPQKTIFSCHTPISVLDPHLLETSCLWVPNSVLLPGMGSSFLLVLFLVIGVQQKLNSEHLFLLSSLKLTSVKPPCNARLNLLPPR